MDPSDGITIKANINKDPRLACVACSNLPLENMDAFLKHIQDQHMNGNSVKTFSCNVCLKSHPIEDCIPHFKIHYRSDELQRCNMKLFNVFPKVGKLKRVRITPAKAKKQIKKFKKDVTEFSVSYDYSNEHDHDQCLTLNIVTSKDQRKMDCKICQNDYSRMEDLEKHIISDHYPHMSLVCLKCSATAGSFGEMCNHIHEKHPSGDARYMFKVVNNDELVEVKQEPEVLVKQEPEDYEEMENIPMTAIFVKQEKTD